MCFPFLFVSLLSPRLRLSTTQESSFSRQELSGDTHYAMVQPEKVVRAPASYKTPSQPWPPTAEIPPERPTRGIAPRSE